MKFDVYYPFKNKKGVWCPGVKPVPTEWADIKKLSQKPEISSLYASIRAESDKAKQSELKKQLPTVCYVGECTGTTRKASAMQPTQLVMIDIDHVKDLLGSYKALFERMNAKIDVPRDIAVVHVTPRQGLRVVFKARKEFSTLEENMQWFNETFKLEDFGYFDAPCKDFSRLSFLFKGDELLYESAGLYIEGWISGKPLENTFFGKEEDSKGQLSLFGQEADKVAFTNDELARFEAFCYQGSPLKTIVDKYIEVFGEPSDGEKHNYYNEMVKYFRCIADNDKRLLLWLLPRFGHSMEECESQIASICRTNTLSSLPRKFYFFLKDNGFYKPKGSQSSALKDYMLSEQTYEFQRPAFLPPVFRELVGTAPDDFVLPCINALMPILGTLTSYVQAVYPYDARMHTTSFFSVIYAPPSTGKGFVERFIDLLFDDLRLRDLIQSERENIYLRTILKKGANEKSPDSPHTSLRLIPPKNSEAEFLQKQKDNCGYHMFTYAAEMDSWSKGVKAAGGNKDDMIRIAWDNGEYGQQFKSANTFKGTVKLYWNVLITGTLMQIQNYFKNVENGLVTRCAFTSIENQEFAKPQKWKSLSKRAMNVIKEFTSRCDANSYEEPCLVVPEDIKFLSDEEFDKEVDWRFKFKPRQTIDCSWIMPVIDKFQEEQMKKAALDIDRARDVFRRRVGVRGFRLAMLCMCLYKKLRQADLENCKQFIDWWMHQDIESMLKLWGDKYNEITDVAPTMRQRKVFESLGDTFSKNDVYTVCMKLGIKTQVRRILYEWKKIGRIDKVKSDEYVKK